jgi:hypothetical protein
MRSTSLVACLLIGASSAAAHETITTKLTWTREISRIVYKRCVSCHQEGGSAFSLVNYEEARPWAKAIKEEVLTRRMPPWNAVKGFGDFKDDAGLTQEQITLIAEWVEGGAPQGDPVYLPSKPRLRKPRAAEAVGAGMRVTGTVALKATAEFAAIQPGPLEPGDAVQVTALRPDGTVEPLLWVQNFNQGFNQTYYFAEPVRLPAGTKIAVTGGGEVTLFRRKL